MSRIKCINFKKYEKGSLIGFADLYIEKTGMEIFGFSVFKKENSKWVSFPSKEYTGDDGEIKYAPIMRFKDPETQKMFCKLALEEIERFVQSPETHENKDEEMPF